MGKKKEIQTYKKDDILFETKSNQEIIEYFNSNENTGLTTQEVNKRRNDYGLNKLAEKKKKTIIGMFFSQLKDPMIYILIAAAIISFVISFLDTTSNPGTITWSTANIDYIEPIVILVVVLLNGIIGTVQEKKAEKSLEALKQMTAPTSVVKRDGKIITIKAEELVPGDIVILEEGSQVPADVRLLKSVNMKVDESSLTGESTPVEKDANIVFSQEMALGDKANYGFMSTPVVYGHGEAIVVATGMNTQIGKIANMLQDGEDETTPLQKKLASLSKLLGIIAIGLVVVFFVIAIIQASLQGKDMLNTIITMFVTAISLAVAAVPEGLPAVVTIVLATGVTRMSKVNVNVKKLHSVETLGSVTVVCSDKTGTLTQNKMTVVKAYTLNQEYEISKFSEYNSEILINLAKGMSMCSNASIQQGVAYGDPTEVALVEFSNTFGFTKEVLDEKHPRLNELPFDSVRKMMSVQHKHKENVINFTKGALDQILKYTTKIYDNGNVRDITKKDIDLIYEESKKMSLDALRVLALAYSFSTQLEEKNLIFYGIVGMVDPPRKEAKPAVKEFKKAGIITVMITGDHKDTAYAIAKELGIVEKVEDCISGSEIDLLSEDELKEVVKHTRVFARVSPENKVSIVKAFKANGNIVAMTGDGVNDAPSLKSADIGIAMGITGTDVAKGAADMVLNDDNFASIEKAVEEGRAIYANIRKTVLFLLSSNIGEVFCMLIAVCLGLPTPLAAIHILFVNLITDSIPAIALGSDAKDPNIMNEKPRDPKEGLFAHGGVFTLVFYGIVIGLITLMAFLYHPIMEVGFNLEKIINVLNTNEYLLLQSETCAFIVLGLSQLFHMIGISNRDRSFIHVFKERNWLFLLSFVIGFGFTVCMTEIDAVANVFGCTTIDWQHWLALTALSMVPLVFHEIIVFIKWIFNKKNVTLFYKVFLLISIVFIITLITLIILAFVL